MYAHPITGYPIARFFEWAHIPAHIAAGVDFGDCGYRATCDLHWLQNATTNGYDRNTVAAAIAQAERVIESYIGRRLSPRWECERVPYPKGANRRDCKNKTVELKHPAIAIGRRGATFLATIPVGYTDRDGDGIRETAIAVFTAPSLPSGLQAFYPARGGDADYRIKPVRIYHDGLQVVVEGKIWDFVEPNAYQSTNLSGGVVVNGCCNYDNNGVPIDPCPLVKSIDLYVVAPDTSNAVKLIYADSATCRCDALPCQTSVMYACAQITSIGSFVRIMPDNGGCECWCNQEPDFVEIEYLSSGCGCAGMDCYCEEYEFAVFNLAAAWLPYNSCGCQCENTQIKSAQHAINFQTDMPFATSANSDMLSLFVYGRRGELAAANILRGLRRG